MRSSRIKPADDGATCTAGFLKPNEP